MSAGTPPGGVQIVFGVDRSQVDAALAELRQGVKVPVTTETRVGDPPNWPRGWGPQNWGIGQVSIGGGPPPSQNPSAAGYPRGWTGTGLNQMMIGGGGMGPPSRVPSVAAASPSPAGSSYSFVNPHSPLSERLDTRYENRLAGDRTRQTRAVERAQDEIGRELERQLAAVKRERAASDKLAAAAERRAARAGESTSARVERNWDAAQFAEYRLGVRERAKDDREASGFQRQQGNLLDRAVDDANRAARRAERQDARKYGGGGEDGGEGGGGAGGGRGAGGGPGSRIFGVLRAGRLGLYASAGYLAYQAYGLAEGYGNETIQSELARTKAERLAVHHWYEEIPFSAGFTYNTRRQRALAEQREQERINDSRASIQRNVEEARATVTQNVAAREAARLGIVQSIPRQLQEIQDAARQRNDVEQSHLYELDQARLERGLTPQEQTRRAEAFTAYEKQLPLDRAANAARDRAAAAAIKREAGYSIQEQRIGENAIATAAGGQVGRARYLEASAGWDINYLRATRVSDEATRQQQRTNFYLRGAFIEENVNEPNRERQASAESTRFLLNHDFLGARLRDIQNERRKAYRNAVITGDVGLDLTTAASIEADFGGQESLAKQNRAESIFASRASLGSQIQALRIAVSGPGRPEFRARLAEVSTLTSGTQQQELEAFTRGTPELVPQIARLGQLQLQNFQQEYIRGFKGTEVSSLRQADLSGAGTENAGAVLKDISRAIEELKKVPQTLEEIKTALGNLVAQ